MDRRLLSNVVLTGLLASAVGVSVYTAQAGPMSAVKDSARDSAEDVERQQVAQADEAVEQAHDAARKQTGVDLPDEGAAETRQPAREAGSSNAIDADRQPMQTPEQKRMQAATQPGSTMGTGSGDTMTEAEHRMLVKKAVVELMPTEGNEANGTVTLTQMGDGVMVEATVTGLQPNSTHAIHVHQYGNVTSADGMAAGSHYDPRGHEHALADTVEGHAGDFGNLEADAQGTADFSYMAKGISIAGMNNPILGRAIIVHEKPDDGGQPSGNAGARIAQGVIGIME